jgi:hypothetical protein
LLTLYNPLIDIGANASAEEADEALDDQVVKVNNIVYSFRLQSTNFDKKAYLTYLKGSRISCGWSSAFTNTLRDQAT